jgi:hypothetical protein
MTTKRLLACALAALVGGVLVAKADYFSYNLHGRLEDSVTRFNKQAANLLPIPRGYIDGCITSASSTTVLQVTGCYAVDSTNAVVMNQTATFTKSTAGSWTAGSGNNGMGVGLTITTATWYHVFEILNGGLIDYYFDTSVSAANAPAGTTAFRRIGSFKTDGSSHIISYTQSTDAFIWGTVVSEQNTTVPSSATLIVLGGVPTGVSVQARIRGLASFSGGNGSVLIQSPFETSTTPQAPSGNADSGGLTGAFTDFNILVVTNTSAQVRWSAQSSATTTGILITFGWIDPRGRNN